MTTYIVTKVRKELSDDRTHKHLEGACTDMKVHYTRQQLAASINARNTWETWVGGYAAQMGAISYCPRPACVAQPYINTNPESTRLEILPEC